MQGGAAGDDGAGDGKHHRYRGDGVDYRAAGYGGGYGGQDGVVGLGAGGGGGVCALYIRANMVNPGTIDTTRRNPEWFAKEARRPTGNAEQLRRIPLGRQGTIYDIANACLFLASEESAYITGDQLNVVGGRYMVAAATD